MVNILMEMSHTDRIWAFLILCYVYSISLRRPEKELICHKESNTHTHTQECLLVHSPFVLAWGEVFLG